MRSCDSAWLHITLKFLIFVQKSEHKFNGKNIKNKETYACELLRPCRRPSFRQPTVVGFPEIGWSSSVERLLFKLKIKRQNKTKNERTKAGDNHNTPQRVAQTVMKIRYGRWEWLENHMISMITMTFCAWWLLSARNQFSDWKLEVVSARA